MTHPIDPFDNSFLTGSLRPAEIWMEQALPKKDNVSHQWIQTFSGGKLYPLKPRLEDISIIDIAHALSMICRFTGHSRQFYSVAQHSVLVSHVCDKQDARHGLLHDSSEFALSDFNAPLKHSGEFENYKMYEKQLQSLIYRKFGLSIEEPPSVKEADIVMLATEVKDLMQPLHPDWVQPVKPLPFKIEPLSPTEAEMLFLDRFYELFGRNI